MTSRSRPKPADPRPVVAANRLVKPGIRLLSFRAPAIARQAEPGQFLHVRVPAAGRITLRRPFSIHDVSGARISILYRIVGAGTEALSRVQPGNEIDVIGPLGNPFAVDHRASFHLVVAGGIGIAPMQLLLRRMTSAKLRPLLFYGCLSKCDLLPHGNVKRVITTDDGTCGAKGFITGAFERQTDRYSGAAVYACGPWPMLRAVSAICRERKFSCQVSLEASMACGVGACQGCVVKGTGSYLTVCHDGPVFDAAVIDWDQEPAV